MPFPRRSLLGTVSQDSRRGEPEDAELLPGCAVKPVPQLGPRTDNVAVPVSYLEMFLHRKLDKVRERRRQP